MQELKRWGIKNASHRRKFLEAKDMIVTASTSAPPSAVKRVREWTMEAALLSLVLSLPPHSSKRLTPPPVHQRNPLVCLTSLLPLNSSSSLPFSRQQSFVGGSLSQGSQLSVSSTQPVPSTFEVLQIQLRKKFHHE